MNALNQLSQALTDLPLPPGYETIGRYYQALCINNFGRGDLDKAQTMQECMTAEAPLPYRARATLSLAAIYTDRGDLQTSLSLYSEAGHLASTSGLYNPYALVHAQRMIAVINGMEGDHRRAVNILENLFPLAHSIRTIHPHVYYDYLNSLAVEYMGVGRLEEARNVSQTVTQSPFAIAYPEWRETRDEIAVKEKRASHSIVSVPAPSAPEEEMPLSVDEPDSEPDLSRPVPAGRPGNVLIFPQRAHATEEPSPNPYKSKITRRELQGMPVAEKRAWAVQVILREDTPVTLLDEFLETAGLVMTEEEEARPKVIDLETPGQLEQVVRLWVNGEINPEDFASVISALRDCEDDLRRMNIMDEMIGYAFNESCQKIESEDDWRRRVEAQLTPDPSGE
ncbi:MAG: hypothetical protein L0229_02895 [Blastocatellia bacterium]|nr:hypothetical protein [Blastocatellia bacterium]